MAIPRKFLSIVRDTSSCERPSVPKSVYETRVKRARGDLNPCSPAFFHNRVPGGLRTTFSFMWFGALIRTGQRAPKVVL